MTITEETLMAFADDELDPVTHDAVAAAVRADPRLEERVAKHRALRASLQREYAADLRETPPERLLAAARAAATHGGADNAAVARPAPKSRTRRIRTWASMAASLVIGVAVGFFALRQSSSIVTTGGGLVAGGALAKALSEQLGSERGAAAPVQVGLSFRSKSGEYCRTFTLAVSNSATGMACRHADDWQIQALAPGAEGSRPEAGYRTAGSGLSPLILAAIQQQMAGEPLDRDAEIAARERGWRASGH